MADRYGRKGTLTLGLVVFGIGSICSAAAGDATVLIATRALMGVGGAMIMPATLSILGTLFPDPAERGRAIAIWAAMASVGIAIGPVLGGVLLAHFGWGSIFMINLPVVAAALLGGRFLLPTSKDPSPGALDPLGSLLSIVALGALVYSVIEGPSRGWTSQAVVLGAGIGVVALVAFIGWEQRCDHPMLPLELFRNLRFTGGAVTLMMLYFAALGTYFLYTQQLQFVLGASALKAGVYSLPFAPALVLGSLLTPWAVRRFGTGRVAATGLLVLSAAAAVRATASANTGADLQLICLMVIGFGVGCTIAPSTGAIMSSLTDAQAGVGSAINDAARQVGAATGVAVLGSVWASSYHRSLAVASAHAHVPANVLASSRSSIGAALDAAHALPPAAQHQFVGAAKEAFVHGTDVANIVAVVVACVGALLAYLLLPRRLPAAAVSVLATGSPEKPESWVAAEEAAG
jgi:EmrB/QacA subfamily drug resistance transporter